MKYRLILLVGIVVIGIIVGINMRKESTMPINEKIPFPVETVFASALPKTITMQKSAIMKAGTQVTLTAQTSGRIGGIYVRAGEKVVVGQTLLEIDDTYGTANNAREEAAIALQTAELTFASTKLTLNQSVKSAEVAYERAKQEYENARLNATPGEESKAQLDYDTFITTQERTLASYETSYQNQLQNLQSLLANVLDTSDSILGVSDANRNQNNAYEFLVGAADTAQKTRVEMLLQTLLSYNIWSPDPSLPLLDRVLELQRVYSQTNELLTGMETVLINTVTDSSRMPEATLAAHRATIDGYQTQYTTLSSGLVTFLNTVQTFLATYENDRLSREKTIQTLESTTKDTVTLAQNAYETAKNSRDVTLKQLVQNISAAQVRLRGAQGNINRLLITAPVSGVVGKVQVDIGEELSNGRPVIDIASDDAECDITVDSGALEQLQTGMGAQIEYRGKSLPGKIISISPIADTGLNFSVKIGVNASVDVFGDFATIRIPLTALFPTLPLTAVNILAPGQGQVYVLKMTNDEENGEISVRTMTNENPENPMPNAQPGTQNFSIETKNVILGNLWDDRVEITSELRPTDEIIMTDIKNYNQLDYVLQKVVGSK